MAYIGRMGKRFGEVEIIAVSGGPDSVYLVYLCRKSDRALVLAHFNHRARGKESDEDQRFVESLSRSLGIPLEVGVAIGRGGSPGSEKSAKGKIREVGFEMKAREERHRYLREVKKKHGAKRILMAHTADDQVETILMRVLEGAGISGLKGIPWTTKDGIERPLLSTWREDILRHLRKQKIPFRVDKSNLDTRFERNWVRHVLLPLLEKRYGKSVRKRIFTLGERFRELDAYIEENAKKWLNKNSNHHSKKRKSEVSRPASDGKETVTFSRKAFSAVPSVLRMKILQILCFDRIGRSPNERLLGSMDRLIVFGGPSARLSVGRGAMLRCRYGEAFISLPKQGEKSEAGKARTGRKGMDPFLRMDGPGTYRWKVKKPERGGSAARYPRDFVWEERARIPPGRIRRLAEGARCAAFDKEMVASPLSIRPLRAGGRIRPFALDADKK